MHVVHLTILMILLIFLLKIIFYLLTVDQLPMGNTCLHFMKSHSVLEISLYQFDVQESILLYKKCYFSFYYSLFIHWNKNNLSAMYRYISILFLASYSRHNILHWKIDILNSMDTTDVCASTRQLTISLKILSYRLRMSTSTLFRLLAKSFFFQPQ